MDIGDFRKFSSAFVLSESTEDICSSRDCGFLCGEGNCSNGALDLLAACCLQPFIGVFCFQPFFKALLALVSFRDAKEQSSKVWAG